MVKKRKAIYFVIVVLLLLGFYFIGNRGSEKVAPGNTIESPPAAESAMPSTERSEESTKIEKQTLIPPPSSQGEKMERPPSLQPVTHGESDNLEEQSYSIKNKKKEISITPGVTFQPGKSISVKIPGEDETIRIKLDKTYHPGGYNVLWEKKY
ncbi:hypothetical protein [Pelosinus sp. UFO1]|uniref:hypothetical protein n=1 Tax=Pelosinus sp. UFO1 TaxID=484770 RepID=UPI0004D0C335|nr:hypothetical protein [Pelosinus sp. UFO1]AIF53193.1 hypothetical protein UFO1_3650 [Pelosinus sp. UFO1]